MQQSDTRTDGQCWLATSVDIIVVYSIFFIETEGANSWPKYTLFNPIIFERLEYLKNSSIHTQIIISHSYLPALHACYPIGCHYPNLTTTTSPVCTNPRRQVNPLMLIAVDNGLSSRRRCRRRLGARWLACFAHTSNTHAPLARVGVGVATHVMSMLMATAAARRSLWYPIIFIPTSPGNALPTRGRRLATQ